MLVKLTDHRGKERWINPLYVKMIQPKGSDQTEIDMAGIATKIRVKGTPDEIATMIDAATPDLSIPIIAADEAALHSAAAANAGNSGAMGAAMAG
jgi:hypothetical protein